jgi:predicted membrane-bound spermidine synthase
VSGWIASLDLHERWGSLLAAAALFFLPSVLLGTVSPYAIRLVTQDVASVGAKAGTLYAISTIGSFLGCLMTSFYLILWLGITHILFLAAGTLVLVAAFLLMMWYGRAAPRRSLSS